MKKYALCKTKIEIGNVSKLANILRKGIKSIYEAALEACNYCFDTKTISVFDTFNEGYKNLINEYTILDKEETAHGKIYVAYIYFLEEREYNDEDFELTGHGWTAQERWNSELDL